MSGLSEQLRALREIKGLGIRKSCSKDINDDVLYGLIQKKKDNERTAEGEYSWKLNCTEVN